jgi:hypothetical protein
VTETQVASARPWRKTKGLGPRFHSGRYLRKPRCTNEQGQIENDLQAEGGKT